MTPYNGNLPPGCTDRDIEEAFDGDYESPLGRRERIEEEKADMEED